MCDKQAELFKILGVGSRIKIIELLKNKGPLGVNEISENLGISPSAVSQHLKTLKYAKLVSSERKGYCIPYNINPDALEECKDYLDDICCCCCEGDVKIVKIQIEKSRDKTKYLKAYEKELQKELKKVQERISELKKK